MNRHELAMRNRALAEKRLRGLGPRGPFPSLTRRARQARSGRKPERILVVCPGGPDYALFSTPALYALRLAYPLTSITALVGFEAEPVLRHNRDINELRVVPVLGVPPEEASPHQLGDWPDALDAGRYDAALVMAPPHWVAALLTARARVPRRLGIDDGSGAGGYLTDCVERDSHAHAVTHNLRLVEALVGAPPTVEKRLNFWMSDAVVALAYRSALADLSGDPRPLVAIDPGDGSRPADWRAEGWAFVADQLIFQCGVNVVLFGSRQAQAQRQAIARGMRFEPTLIEGPLDSLFAAALFARCALVMGGYSSLIHLAVALQRPALLLYGPHDPAELGPWGDPELCRVLRSPLLCSPCRLPLWPGDSLDNHPCVRDIDSYAVLDTALELLAVTLPLSSSGAKARRRTGGRS